MKQERSSLLKKLTTLKDLDCAYSSDKLAAADVDQPMTLNITGLETFCLGYKVFVCVFFKHFSLHLSCDSEMIYLIDTADSMATISCNFKEGFNKVSIDLSSIVSLQTC